MGVRLGQRFPSRRPVMLCEGPSLAPHVPQVNARTNNGTVHLAKVRHVGTVLRNLLQSFKKSLSFYRLCFSVLIPITIRYQSFYHLLLNPSSFSPSNWSNGPIATISSVDQLGRQGTCQTIQQSLFLQRVIVNISGMDRDVHSSTSIRQGALKNGFGEAVFCTWFSIELSRNA